MPMTKEEIYKDIIPQIQALVAGETDLIANMANIAAVLHENFHFWWTGFYIVKDDEQSAISHQLSAIKQILVLGPFQGPLACTRIPYNKGVCGTAWAQNQTLIVPNVHEFHEYSTVYPPSPERMRICNNYCQRDNPLFLDSNRLSLNHIQSSLLMYRHKHLQ